MFPGGETHQTQGNKIPKTYLGAVANHHHILYQFPYGPLCHFMMVAVIPLFLA
jgi:hypothetical protein